MRRSRPRLSYANVASTLALVLALGGGAAYAAATIGSADVIDNSLVSADLKNNAAVTSADVVNDNVNGGGLGSVDIAGNSLTGNDIREDQLFNVNKGEGVSLLIPAEGQPPATRLLASSFELRLIARCSNPTDGDPVAELRIASTDEPLIWAIDDEGAAVNDGALHGPTSVATLASVKQAPTSNLEGRMLSFVAHGGPSGSSGLSNAALTGTASLGLVDSPAPFCRFAFGGSGGDS